MNQDSRESSDSHSESRSAPGSMKLFYLFTMCLVVPDNECDLQLRMARKRLLTKQEQGWGRGTWGERGRLRERKQHGTIRKGGEQERRGQEHLHANFDKFDNKVWAFCSHIISWQTDHFKGTLRYLQKAGVWMKKMFLSPFVIGDSSFTVLSVILQQKASDHVGGTL